MSQELQGQWLVVRGSEVVRLSVGPGAGPGLESRGRGLHLAALLQEANPAWSWAAPLGLCPGWQHRQGLWRQGEGSCVLPGPEAALVSAAAGRWSL